VTTQHCAEIDPSPGRGHPANGVGPTLHKRISGARALEGEGSLPPAAGESEEKERRNQSRQRRASTSRGNDRTALFLTDCSAFRSRRPLAIAFVAQPDEARQDFGVDLLEAREIETSAADFVGPSSASRFALTLRPPIK